MSRSKQILENPAIRTFKWKNRKEEIQKDPKGKALKDDKGKPLTEVVRETGWYYWDKNIGEKGAEVKKEMPFSIIWLESAFSMTGFHKNREKGIYSTEVLDLKTQPMVVKCENETIAEGLYSEIKDEVKGLGAKFCNAVYALMKNEDDEWEVVRFLMAGSSGGSWIENSNRSKNKSHAIVFYDTKEKFTPKGDMYEEPVFKYLELSEEDLQEADRIASEVVDPFFEYYLNRPKEEKPITAGSDTDDDYN